MSTISMVSATRSRRPAPSPMKPASPIGSLVIVEAKDRAGAEAIAKNDPYAKAGLFAAVEIRAWKWGLKNPEVK